MLLVANTSWRERVITTLGLAFSFYVCHKGTTTKYLLESAKSKLANPKVESGGEEQKQKFKTTAKHIDRYIFSNRNIQKIYNSVTRSLDRHYCLSSPRTQMSPVK